MTRDEMVVLIKEQLGFRTTLDANIVRYLTLAQIALEKLPDKPWFLMSEDSFTITTADEERVEVPADFIEEVEDATFKYRPDTYPTDPENDLIKDGYDNLRQVYVGSVTGPPEAYALLGNYFRIFPTPDDDYNVRLIYYKKAAALAVGSDSNVWSLNAPHLLMGTAGMHIGTAIRDKDATSTFQSWISADMQAINNKNVARDVANQILQVGGRHF